MTNRNNLGRGIGLALTAGTTALAAPEFLALTGKTLVKPMVEYPIETLGAIGGHKAVNWGMKKLTGQDWNEYWKNTGVPEWVAEISNPGNVIGVNYAQNVVRRGLFLWFYRLSIVYLL